MIDSDARKLLKELAAILLRTKVGDGSRLLNDHQRKRLIEQVNVFFNPEHYL